MRPRVMLHLTELGTQEADAQLGERPLGARRDEAVRPERLLVGDEVSVSQRGEHVGCGRLRRRDEHNALPHDVLKDSRQQRVVRAAEDEGVYFLFLQPVSYTHLTLPTIYSV